MKTNKLILSGLILIVISAFAATTFIPKANAQAADEYGVYHGYGYGDSFTVNPVPVVNTITPNSGNIGSGPQTITIIGNGFTPTSIARVNGSNRPTTFIDDSHLLTYLSANDMYGASGRYITVFNPAPSGGYSNASFYTINGYVAPGKASAPANTGVYSNTSDSQSTNSTSTQTPTTSNGAKELTSNAIFGSNGFMPSGLVQWLLLAVFILLIVIIVRKVYGADKYHAKPLKHS